MAEQERRTELLASLRRISPMPPDEGLTAELLDRHEEILNALRPIINEDCIEPLIASFGYGDAFEGYWPVIHLLESLPKGPVHAALLRSLQAGADGARMWSAFMLGRQKELQDVSALVKAADDPCELVRVNAVRALGAIGTTVALEAVSKKTSDPSAIVRQWANEVTKDG